MVALEEVEISQEPSTEDKEESVTSESEQKEKEIEKEKPAPKKRGRPKKEAAPTAEPKKRGRPPLPPKELPQRVPQPEPQISSTPTIDEATLNQYVLKALLDHKQTSVRRREEHWRGLVKF